jgi:hypothetical protein
VENQENLNDNDGCVAGAAGVAHENVLTACLRARLGN